MIITGIHLLSAIGGSILTAILVAKLVMFPEHYKLVERAGMGIVGGTMIMRIGPIMATPESR